MTVENVITLVGMVVAIVGAVFGSAGYWDYKQKKLEKIQREDPENFPTNKAIMDKLTLIEEDSKELHVKVEHLSKRFEFSEMNEARRRIINAAEEIEGRGEGKFPISKERGMQLRKDIKTYEEFCNSHEDYENDQCPVAIKVCQKYMSDDGEWFKRTHNI